MASLKEIIDNNELPVTVYWVSDYSGPDFTIVNYDPKRGSCEVIYDGGVPGEVGVDNLEFQDKFEVFVEGEDRVLPPPPDFIAPLDFFAVLRDLEGSSGHGGFSYSKAAYREALLYLTWDSPDMPETLALWDKFDRYFKVMA